MGSSHNSQEQPQMVSSDWSKGIEDLLFSWLRLEKESSSRTFFWSDHWCQRHLFFFFLVHQKLCLGFGHFIKISGTDKVLVKLQRRIRGSSSSCIKISLQWIKSERFSSEKAFLENVNTIWLILSHLRSKKSHLSSLKLIKLNRHYQSHSVMN